MGGGGFLQACSLDHIQLQTLPSPDARSGMVFFFMTINMETFIRTSSSPPDDNDRDQESKREPTVRGWRSAWGVEGSGGGDLISEELWVCRQAVSPDGRFLLGLRSRRFLRGAATPQEDRRVGKKRSVWRWRHTLTNIYADTHTHTRQSP